MLGAVLGRFSPLALAAVVALAVTGTAQAVAEVGSVDALVASAYGRAVVVKAALLAALVGLGALHRRRTLPALRSDGPVPRLLARALWAEVALVVAALAVAGALAGYPPPP